VQVVDIEQFYDADERRRESQEIEFGSDWHDGGNNRFELSYVVDTGELYLMASPEAESLEDAFGDIAVDNEPVEGLTVRIIATVPTAAELAERLAGWEDEMPKPASIAWLEARFGASGGA
jgi:hypothetical protein